MKIQDIEIEIISEINRILNEKFGTEQIDITLSDPPENIDAEYSVPCFSAAKAVRQSPMKIASELVQHFTSFDWLDTIDAAGPYLNVKIKPTELFRIVINQALTQKECFGHSSSDNPQTVLVEYSSPNTNKPLHLGHIRNNALGMAIINLLKAAGNKVIPASILNDKGIHICKAMTAYKLFGENATPESENMKGDHFIGKYYVAFDRESRTDPTLIDKAREMLQLWENNDPNTRKLWNKMNKWVYEGFEETYHRLGSTFDLIQHESQTYTFGRDIVKDGVKKNVLFQNKDGSIWIDLEDMGLDKKVLLRSDGTSVYITQDLGVAVERFQKHNLNRVIYVVGSEQNYHFNVLFEVLKRLGYSWSDQCYHLSYGMVYLPEGKMKSREGIVVDADQLLDKMKEMALEVMASSKIPFESDDQDKIAEAIGVGAVKYFILKVNPQKDIHFDPKASLSFEGATGAYLQYSYARIQSILRKAGGKKSEGQDFSELAAPEELALIRTLMRYPGVLLSAAADLNPSRIATYSWDLAKAFNSFYHKHRILKASTKNLMNARLALAEATAAGLQSSLNVLGIQPLHRM